MIGATDAHGDRFTGDGDDWNVLFLRRVNGIGNQLLHFLVTAAQRRSLINDLADDIATMLANEKFTCGHLTHSFVYDHRFEGIVDRSLRHIAYIVIIPFTN